MFSEEASLLAEIVAAPDDDPPRLVYADWLDEHGQSERAELIRVQCELARLTTEDPRRTPLIDRETQLLREYNGTWAAPLEALGARNVQIKRGFVESVKLHSLNLLSHAGELFQAAPVLLHLDLFSVRDRIAQVLQLEPLAQLTSLSIVGELIGPRGAQALARAEHLVRLRRLNLTANLIRPEGVRHLAGAPLLANLQELNLSANALGNEGLAALYDQPAIRRIDAILLRNNGFGEAGARTLNAWQAVLAPDQRLEW